MAYCKLDPIFIAKIGELRKSGKDELVSGFIKIDPLAIRLFEREIDQGLAIRISMNSESGVGTFREERVSRVAALIKLNPAYLMEIHLYPECSPSSTL